MQKSLFKTYTTGTKVETIKNIDVEQYSSAI